VLTLAGCAGAPQRGQPDLTDSLRQPAQLRVAQGDYLGAAQLYLDAAAAASEAQRTELRLAAADLLAEGQLWDRLTALLEGFDPTRLDRPQQSQYRLLHAELALSRRDPAQALAQLAGIASPDTLADSGKRYYQLRADAYVMSGNALEAARQLIWLDGLIRDQQQRLDNQYRIWQQLSSLSSPALQQLQTSSPAAPLGGWIELIMINRATRGDQQRWNDALYRWRARYPGHAAEAALLPELYRQLDQARTRPRAIGVLLPLSGRAAESAAAIRDGLLAAYYWGEGARPELRFYDTDQEGIDVDAAYRQAVEQGAEIIIGPLLKENVAQLAQSGPLQVPVLALNQIDLSQPAEQPAGPLATATPDTQTPAPLASPEPASASPDPLAASAPGQPPAEPLSAVAVSDQPLYQFGLAPEDEARQAAERLIADGYDQVITLVPDNAWGERVTAAFTDHLGALGGTLLDSALYAPDSVDFKAPIQQALNLDQSKARHRALERLLGQKLQYEARRRQDIEAFFLLGFPQQARLIRPQLRFHRAADTPVFGTSHLYSAAPNPALDRDMDGLIFCDMPWVLDRHGEWAAKRDRLASLWPERSTRYPRLFALGFDAYQVLPWLDTLTLPGFGYFPGATGVLSLDSDHALQRTLEWAQFRQGVPQPLQEATQGPSMEGPDEPQIEGGPR
jgi:outer membrane PBP1 activator LpoA protein